MAAADGQHSSVSPQQFDHESRLWGDD